MKQGILCWLITRGLIFSVPAMFVHITTVIIALSILRPGKRAERVSGSVLYEIISPSLPCLRLPTGCPHTAALTGFCAGIQASTSLRFPPCHAFATAWCIASPWNSIPTRTTRCDRKGLGKVRLFVFSQISVSLILAPFWTKRNQSNRRSSIDTCRPACLRFESEIWYFLARCWCCLRSSA